MPCINYKKDEQYLVNKFRNPVFDPSTGMSNNELRDKMKEVAENFINQGLSRPEVKAACFKYICENMQIDVDPHDFFPMFGTWIKPLRPIGPLIIIWYDEMWEKQCKDIAEEYFKRNESGISTVLLDFDHSVPDWDVLLELGFPGLRDRAEEYREIHRKNGTLTQKAEDYFNGLKITATALIDTIGRFIDFAQQKYPDDPRIKAEIECLKHLQTGSPRNTYEALQFIYLYFMFGEYIDHFQVRSLGNLDRLLYPYYKRDLAEERFTYEDIRELLTHFLMQWGSINNYWGHPFYLGGTKADGTTEYNELSLIILDVFDKLSIPTPKIQLKIAKNTPHEIFEKACDMIRRGHNSIVFVSEDTIKHIMTHLGYTEEEARTCRISGCYEFGVYGKSNGTGAGNLNLLKPIELIFNDGVEPLTGMKISCDALKLSQIKTFDDFLASYFEYIKEALEKIIYYANRTESQLGIINPANIFSLSCENSLETAKDAFFDGSVYCNSGISLTGIASAVDALMAVKKLVFEDKELTLSQFKEILAANWQGHEKLRQRILQSPLKYGNGIYEVDKYADIITSFIADFVHPHKNGRGGTFGVSGHCARSFILHGAKTGATPDGRAAGEEMSKNCSPVIGMDRKGVTAMINSMTTMQATNLPGDFPLDVMMHPATVKGEEGIMAMKALIYTFFAKHGHAIHFNIFDPETLVDAQKNPEKYSGLQIRVCGWNVHFTDLAKSEQDFYIKRAFNIVE